MHIIPDLKRLEEKYKDDLVVIGVHSAKFQTERQTSAIREAILRYGIKHPVINDSSFAVWSEYGARAWPTLVLINPNGRIIGTHSGEGIYDLFDNIIGQAVKYFDAKGELNHGPIKFAPEEERAMTTVLSFPGKVSSDQKTGRLFISDSNHDRVIITDGSGKILDVIGSGKKGKADGSFDAAEFANPQGTALKGDILYIADTDNHLIRAADLKTRTVRTILGTGEQARQFNVAGDSTDVALNSPWDVVTVGNKLYIAMAGSHQIWAADLTTLHAQPYAGSARENIEDGPLHRAALAQPSGITTDGKRLYIADSEVSGVREIDLDPSGEVHTIIGHGLFDYGDVDGSYDEARLQHPLGIAYHDGLLYIADTYNSKIKIVDPVKRTSKSLAGTGKGGYRDGSFDDSQFNEPGGLAFLGDSIIVADVNNHVIRVANLNTRKVSTLDLSNLQKLQKRQMDTFAGRVVEVGPRSLKPGDDKVVLNIKLPQGYHFNNDAPFYLSWKSDDEKIVKFTIDPRNAKAHGQSFPLELPVSAMKGGANLTVDAIVYFCKNESSVCLFDNIRFKVPVTVAETGMTQINIDETVRTL
jgi:sugar lactone lactonase YvrE